MPGWITHLMIADRILQLCPTLDRRGFCVGSIAPDCNVENEDWTVFTPPREVTHWMRQGQKTVAGADEFYQTYVAARTDSIMDAQERAFLMGYYAHLVADAQHNAFLRDGNRLRQVWQRIRADKTLNDRAGGCCEEDWETIRKLIARHERMRDMELLEAEYLREHPDSGFLTEILPLESFPDYIDYLPPGGIVRKIRIMGKVPDIHGNVRPPIVVSKEELRIWVDDTAVRFVQLLKEKACGEVPGI